MPEQRKGNNHTSKINVFPVSHSIFFLPGGQKMDFSAPHEAIKFTLWPASGKYYFLPCIFSTEPDICIYIYLMLFKYVLTD